MSEEEYKNYQSKMNDFHMHGCHHSNYSTKQEK